MSISYAVLGILSYKSMAGYDIKKIIQDAAFMHWSGNNNQVYKALTELLDKGWVTNEIKYQQSSPTKKIYTITREGLTALKEWVLSPVEPTDIKKPFLVQLACSKQLNSQELKEVIDGYENQVRTQLLMNQAAQQDSIFLTDGTVLETTIWRCINYNIKRTYENEVVWIQDLRKAIADIPNENDGMERDYEKAEEQEDKDDCNMHYSLKCFNEISYLHFYDPETKLESERDMIDIIVALAENNTPYVAFDSKTISSELRELKSGLLGNMLQKFTMYHIKAAVVMEDEKSLTPEFQNAMTESGSNGVFRQFMNIEEAEKWFITLQHKAQTD